MLEDYSRTLSPAAFYIPAHQLVMHGLRTILEKGLVLDFPILKTVIRDAGRLEEAGGLAGLNDIWSYCLHSLSGPYYFKSVSELHRRRSAIIALEKLVGQLRDPHADPDITVQEHVEHALTQIALKPAAEEKPFRMMVLDAVDIIDQNSQNKVITGITFGIPTLDAETFGLQPTERCVITAVTGGGKSALSAQAVLQNAKAGRASAIFSLEMSYTRLIIRMLANAGQVSMGSLKRGTMTEGDYKRLHRAVTELAEYRIFIEDQYSFDITSIVSRCRQLKARHDLSLVVVDYLQLVDCKGSSAERHERLVANVSRNLSRMAKELNLVVIALSQLNDAGQIRDSRAIGHDADMVLQIENSKEAPDDKFAKDIVIDKHRDGDNGKRIPVKFLGQYMTFRDAPSSRC